MSVDCREGVSKRSRRANKNQESHLETRLFAGAHQSTRRRLGAHAESRGARFACAPVRARPRVRPLPTMVLSPPLAAAVGTRASGRSRAPRAMAGRLGSGSSSRSRGPLRPAPRSSRRGGAGGARSSRRDSAIRAGAFSDDASSLPALIERAMDFGEVTKWEGRGGSGWASFFVAETKSGKRLFVKASRRGPEMFAGEAAGLRALRHAKTLVIPEVHFAGATEEGCRDGDSAIVMDFLEFGARGDQAAFGAALASAHLAECLDPEARAGQFGFPVDNTCGDTPQPNAWCDDWVTFFCERRIAHQLSLARDGALSELGAAVIEKTPTWFEPFDEKNPIRPSILHGDLWSGNIGTVAGEPSVFDPATYYGHNEAEFGMSWCAGFSDAFYDAYFATFPKTEKYFEERRLLYRLYHYLNHYNLFGGGYKSQCVSIMKQLLA